MKTIRWLLATSIVATCAMPLLECSREKLPSEKTFVMGTMAWITVAGTDDKNAGEAMKAVFGEFFRIESTMSTWKESSELSNLNRAPRSSPIALSRELFSLIDSCLFYSRLTKGAFDASVRPLVLLWGFQGGSPRVPAQAEIDSVRSLVGWEKIQLDRKNYSVIMPPGMQLDFAGIAKGYAVDRAGEILKRLGIENALVNLGGNILATGKPGGERMWRVGIRDPLDREKTVGTLSMSNEAVATSGNYENFIEIEGRRYGHIIDPRSGRTVENALSVTVLAPTALAADALSTAFFVLGPDEAERICEKLGTIAALFVLQDGQRMILRTVGDFKGKLELRKNHAIEAGRNPAAVASMNEYP